MRPGARLDLHVHSDRSPDSALSLDAIVRGIRGAGLDGFALTDHNTVAGHRALRELARQHPDLVFVPGVEVSTADGHLLAYGVETSPPSGRPLDETIGWVRDHGGEAVPAHPLRLFHGIGETRARRADVRALETCNGQNSPRANRSAEHLARELGRGRTGGSDAHEFAGLGRGFTVVPEITPSLDELLETIRKGRTEAGGVSLDIRGRFRWTVRNAWLRTRRGFRAV